MDPLLITGGAGFIGFNLVEHVLATTPSDVVVVDKVTYAANRDAVAALVRRPRVTFLKEDIGSYWAMCDVFDRYQPAVVLNLAAETHVDRSIDSPQTFINTNVVGTCALLDASRRYLAGLTGQRRDHFRFLHVSTDEVFGTLGPTGRFSEHTPYAPNSPYSASKAAADHLVRAYFVTYGLPTLITNCSNTYGPHQHPEKLIPLMILNALQARRLPIYGDGSNVRDWLHVDDHCSALMTVLKRGVPGESYNIGADNEQTNLALVDRLCDAVEAFRPARFNIAMRAAGFDSYRRLKQFVVDRPGHDRRYALDASKLRRELSWMPAHSFETGLTSTVEWYIEHHHAFLAGRSGYDRERLGLGGVTR